MAARRKPATKKTTAKAATPKIAAIQAKLARKGFSPKAAAAFAKQAAKRGGAK